VWPSPKSHRSRDILQAHETVACRERFGGLDDRSCNLLETVRAEAECGTGDRYGGDHGPEGVEDGCSDRCQPDFVLLARGGVAPVSDDAELPLPAERVTAAAAPPEESSRLPVVSGEVGSRSLPG